MAYGFADIDLIDYILGIDLQALFLGSCCLNSAQAILHTQKMDALLPTPADIRNATLRIQPHIARTPLVAVPELSSAAGGQVFVKLEPLQRSDSFKFRGALNRILCMSVAERRQGVVAWSSGNHAQGVATACALFNVPAVIVMPHDAPALKIANTRKLGAEVVLYDRVSQDRDAIAHEIARTRNLMPLPPFDDPHVIAGQGTLGLELMSQAQDMGVKIDDIIVPASGGGLAAGVGLAARDLNPNLRMFTAEPEGYDDHRRSIITKERVTNQSKANALCDALLAPTPGVLTWQINCQLLHGGYAVSDDQVCAAMAFALRVLKVVVEPGGAVGLASILSNSHGADGRTTAVVLSGGNVDTASYIECIKRGSALDLAAIRDG